MPYTPPFRTRRHPQRLVEPRLGDSDPEADPLKKPLTWTTASAQPLADDPTVPPPVPDDDDDALPVLTQLIEPPAAAPVPTPAIPPAAPSVASPVLPPVAPASPPETTPLPQEPLPGHESPAAARLVDEELVARITDEVMDALQPVLHELVGDAVRSALNDHIRQGGMP